MNYWWDVWVDGVKEPALSTEAGSGLQVYPAYPNQGTNGSLKFLVLGLPARANQTTSPGASMFETLVLTVPDLPSRWIDYTCFDVIALAPGEMQLIAQTRPDALVAICRWVRCGGQLWISPVGDQWEALLDVERLLKGSAGAVGKATIGDDADVAAGDEVPNHTATSAVPLTDDDVVARGWRPIKIASTAQTNSDAATAADDQTVAKNTRADSLAWYVEQPLGLGFVRVYRKAWEPSGLAWSLQMLNAATPPDESPPMPTPLSAALATTRNWESRHGMAPDAANTDFANLLVPGVGLAPVTEFRILITLFALAIGPVNYWLLKRWNRPHLLVLTVPIMAVLVTLALFAHAILSDGFGTTVRVRSFTSLDQRTGEAACWSRLSYYAGLAPARGLKLPDDVAVYPIIPGWNETSNRMSIETARQLEWTGGEAHLTQGWLRSRTPTQYLMLRARKTPIRLGLTRNAEGLSAANELRTAIQYVVATDDEGSFFSGERLAEGGTALLKPTTRVDASIRLRTLVSDNALVVPAELTDESSSFAVSQRRQRRQFFRGQLRLDYSQERLDNNLLSGAITSLADANGEVPLDLPARSFVAITETGPEVATGVPMAVEEESFHVVVGKW
jgi:hypothetical protein